MIWIYKYNYNRRLKNVIIAHKQKYIFAKETKSLLAPTFVIGEQPISIQQWWRHILHASSNNSINVTAPA